MSNRRACSKNITIDGVKVSFATHTLWALAPDGARSAQIVRSRQIDARSGLSRQ